MFVTDRYTDHLIMGLVGGFISGTVVGVSLCLIAFGICKLV